MRIPIDQITAAPKRLAYAEVVDDLNRRLAHGSAGMRVHQALGVEVGYYRAGLDVVIEGHATGDLVAACGRCLENFALHVEVPFRVVLAPKVEEETESRELGDADLGVGFFSGEAIDVTEIVHEQVLLAAPTTQHCRDECRGLCPTCGTNLNHHTCACEPAGPRPRLAVLHDLLRQRSTSD
jgi:uncharacterized protein